MNICYWPMKNILLKYFFVSFILLPARGATHRCLVQKPCSLSFSPGQGFTGYTIPLRDMMSAVPLLMHNLLPLSPAWCLPSIPPNEPWFFTESGFFQGSQINFHNYCILIFLSFMLLLLWAGATPSLDPKPCSAGTKRAGLRHGGPVYAKMSACSMFHGHSTLWGPARGNTPFLSPPSRSCGYGCSAYAATTAKPNQWGKSGYGQALSSWGAFWVAGTGDQVRFLCMHQWSSREQCREPMQLSNDIQWQYIVVPYDYERQWVLAINIYSPVWSLLPEQESPVWGWLLGSHQCQQTCLSRKRG